MRQTDQLSFGAALCVSVAIVLAFASTVNAQQPAPAPQPSPYSIADGVNKELPEWLRFAGEYRVRFEGSTGIKGVHENDDAYVLSRLRLDLLFKLGTHVRVFVEGQDSQAGGFNANPDPPVHQDDFDLRQAYVEFRESDTNGWAFRVGRQELGFGDQRLIGPLNWTNTARTFDAAKLTYTDDRVAVDVFASSVVVVQDDRFDRHFDGQNLYGVYSTFKKAVPKGLLDAYVYWRTTPLAPSERGLPGDVDSWTFGTRLAGAASKHLDYSAELIGQRGSFGSDSIRAGAAHARAVWSFVKSPNVPKLRVEYDFASGDASPADGVHGTFDQLYPTNHARYGVLDQVGLKNLHDVRAGFTVKPHSRVTLDVDYLSFWLAHRRDGLYDAGGSLVVRIPTGATDSHVAQEADIQASIALTRNVSFGAGYGHWFPGPFWKQATPGASRTFTYTMVTYRF